MVSTNRKTSLFLWQPGRQIFDLFEQGLVIVNANAMNEEDDATGSGNRKKHPDMYGETEDRGLRHRRTVIDEGSLDGELEGAYGPGRAGNEIGEVGEGDGKP